jgi:hypothetical protein
LLDRWIDPGTYTYSTSGITDEEFQATRPAAEIASFDTLGGTRLVNPVVPSSLTYRDFSKDGLYYVSGFDDQSGSNSPLTYFKGWGARGTKSGAGNLDMFWASVIHKGSGEAGISIGDVTADATGAGGNLWGFDYVLIDNKGAQMYGGRLAFNPTVARPGKVANGLIVENQNSVSVTGNTTSGSNQLASVSATTLVNGMVLTGAGIPTGTTVASGGGTATITMSANATATASGVAVVGQLQLDQAVRVIGKWDRPFIAYSDAGVTTIFDVDSTGKFRSGHGFPMSSGNFDLGAIGSRWRSLYVNNLLVNGADTGGGSAVLALKDAATNPTGAPSTSGVVVYSSGGSFKVRQFTVPAVTGSRGGNAALASLLTTLASAGLVTDSTTA